jgi:hypothetical protein
MFGSSIRRMRAINGLVTSYVELPSETPCLKGMWKEGHKWREEEYEDVSSYWATLGK